MIISALLLFFFILLIYDYYVHHKRSGRLVNFIPGPKGVPIFGNAFSYQGSQEELWKKIRSLTAEFYPITKVWFLFTSAVLLRDPNDLEKILSKVKHNNKSFMYNLLHPWLKTGLLTSGGTKWQTRRKILTPAFHFHILQHFTDILNEESGRMIQSLKDAKRAVVKDLVPFISEHTLNIICETAMGTRLQDLTMSELQHQYRKAIYKIGEFFIYRLVSPWLYHSLVFELSLIGFQQRKVLNILHGFTEKIIAERKLYHERTNNRYLKCFENDNMEQSDDKVYGRKRRLAMLDLLIAVSKENNMTDLDIREEVDTFMFEGHDTSAMAASFTLLLLAEHKDIQKRVRTEIDSAIQEHGENYTMTLLQNLSYLDRCLKESLRLYPSVHFISRVASEDIELDSYTIPAGVDIHMNIYDIHRDPNFWPNPDVFDPDRFLPEKIRNRHPYSYLPFSAGPRNCIGQRLAILELKALIASLVHHFYLEPVDYLKDLRLKADIILRPARPIRVKFIPIERTQ